MSSTIDSMIFHPLEKAIESDFENDQDYAGRHFGEVLRFASGFYDTGEPGNSSAIDATGRMPEVGGLALNGVGADIVISRGFLMRFSDSVPSAIGPLDSPARVGLLLAPLTLTVPSPGSDVFFLVQAAVGETIISENRDLFNETSQAYEPPASITKRKLQRAVITLKQGTATQIPDPDANNVAIGAFFKVNAVNIVDSDIIDLRPMKRDRTGPQYSAPNITNATSFPICQSLMTQGFGFAHDTISGRWAANVNGFTAFATTRNASWADATALMHSTDAPAANRWYYLYLGQNPRGHLVGTQRTGRAGNAYHARGFYSNCVMALSSVPPTQKGANSLAVPLVLPFEGLSAPIGEMACVGVLRRNSANTGWHPMRISAGGDATMGRLFVDTLDQNSGVANTANRRAITIDLAAGGAGGERLLPVNAVSARGDIATSGTNTTGTARQVEFTFDESLAGTVMQSRGPWVTTVRASNKSLPFDVPIVDSAGASMFMRLWALTDADVPSAASTAAIGTDNTWGMHFTGFTLR